jgi:hypothetical protein
VADHQKRIDALLAQKDYTGAATAEAEFAHRAATETLETPSAESAQDAAQRRAKEDQEKNTAALLVAKNYAGATAAETEFARLAAVGTPPSSATKPTQEDTQRRSVEYHQKRSMRCLRKVPGAIMHRRSKHCSQRRTTLARRLHWLNSNAVVQLTPLGHLQQSQVETRLSEVPKTTMQKISRRCSQRKTTLAQRLQKQSSRALLQ